jgi:hypothetical protein
MGRLEDVEKAVTKINGELPWHFRIGAGGLGLLFVALFAGVIWYLPDQLEKSRGQSKTEMEAMLAPINAKLAVILDRQARAVAENATAGSQAVTKVEATLKEALSEGQDPQFGLTVVKEVAREASDQRVLADPATVGQVGSQVLQHIDRVATSTSAWDAAVQLASYRTQINQQPILDSIGAPMDVGDDVIKQIFPWTFDVMVFGSDKAVDAMLKTNMIQPYGPRTSDYALIQRLGERYEPVEEGASWVVLQGPTAPQSPLVIRLDGYHFKKIVFRDLVISWRGGPMNLENVAFVRCRFAPNRSQPTKQLLREVFASTYITLQTPKT